MEGVFEANGKGIERGKRAVWEYIRIHLLKSESKKLKRRVYCLRVMISRVVRFLRLRFHAFGENQEPTHPSNL